MKFAHELLALEAGCPEEFSGRFIKYKQLKKLIKRIREVEAAGGPDSPEEQQFLHLLNAEVAAVNRTFETYAQELVRMAATKRRRRQGCCLLQLRKSTLKEEELAQHAQWCRRYAMVNATGLRKIAKKHDKYARNDAGKQFVKACWDCRNTDLGAFLHSPLIDELRALEALSEAHHSGRVSIDSGAGASAPPQPAAAAAAPHGSARVLDASNNPTEAAAAPAARSADGSFGSDPSGESEASFRCAICLAPMWMPVGLSCGHIFCAECVFQAVGIKSWSRPLREINCDPQVLADVPPTATCPKCRQRYVFREVLELKEFGAVIRFKYADEVGQRAMDAAAEMSAQRKEQKRLASQQRRSRFAELMEPFPRGL